MNEERLAVNANAGDHGQDSEAVVLDAAQVAAHAWRLGDHYRQVCSAETVAAHARAVAALSSSNLVQLRVDPQGPGTWEVTVVAHDFLSELSIICGLFAAYGLGIQDGKAFTYSFREDMPEEEVPSQSQGRRRRVRRRVKSERTHPLPDRKIVDWFTVAASDEEPDWSSYESDLRCALSLLAQGDIVGARELVAERVADYLRRHPVIQQATFIPVTVDIDNELPEPVTRVEVRSLDSVAFLYELCNAFAMLEVNIESVEIWTREDHIHDVLFLTTPGGGKVTDPRKLNEIRAASVLIKQFTNLLPRAPNPRSALRHFGKMVSQVMSRDDWVDQLAVLEQPEVIRRLARLLGMSDFLWEDFLRQQPDQLMPLVSDSQRLQVRVSAEELRGRLVAVLANVADREARCAAINDFKDREMFRIDMRHIMGAIRLWEFGDELTELAELILGELVGLCYRELVARHGEPCLENGDPCGHSVCALGKFGGKEMGYGSDVELMLLYEGAGRTSGDETLSNSEFFERLVNEFRRSLKSRREGIFELDLRLRPHGSKGLLAVSVDAFRRYFLPDGRARQYERQALIKLRPITGPQALRTRLSQLRDECVYSGWAYDVAEMRDLRRRQVEELVVSGTRNAKFSRGGLVDVEYTTQVLQIRHGPEHPQVREVSTRRAIMALEEIGVLTPDVSKLLQDAYQFLRRIIDALRMVRGNARDLTVPPIDDEEFIVLGRRLGYADQALRQRLVLHLHGYMEVVEQLSVELLGE